MLNGARMRFIVVATILWCAAGADAKSVKKSSKDESAVLNKKLIGKAKPAVPAIIAIEIVDPNENATSSRNKKRTIGSSLGYGYQNFHAEPPRYQVYKYSQHDIPPFRGPTQFGAAQYDVQKSVSYKLPSQSYTGPIANHQYYQPGTTLFSTLNHQGQAGGLTAHLPQQQYDPQVPVIILRVLPSQLADPSAVLKANLPQSHPLASSINSIDIQALLNKYVKNLLTEQPGQSYQQQSSYQDHGQSYQQQPETNYQYSGQQEPGYHQQEYQTQQGYYYNQPTYQDEQNYQYVQQPQYQQTYSEHSSSASHDSNADDLLTHENYPKDTHTRVIFRTDKNKAGHSPPVETKTIKVTLPQSISGVQVEGPGYSNQDGYYYDTQQGDSVMQSYYYAQPEQYQQQTQQEAQGLGSYGQAAEVEPRNYRAHQKRSRKKSAGVRVPEGLIKDINTLQPIKA